MLSTKKIIRNNYIFILKRVYIIVFIFNFLLVGKVLGQTKVPCNEITKEMNFIVHSVRIEGRWVPPSLQSKVEEMVGLGQQFDPGKVPPAQNLVRDELIMNEEQLAIPLIGSTSALFITSDICDISEVGEPKKVQIIIRPYYLRIDLYDLGNNILPVPRSAKPTFFQQVPSALMATAPLLGLTNDREYGLSLLVQTKTDLFDLIKLKRSEKGFRKMRLDLVSNARKSLSNPFNNLGVGLTLSYPIYSENRLGWSLGIHHGQNLNPLGLGEYKREVFRVFGSIQGRFRLSFLDKYVLGGSARFLKNRYNILPETTFQNPDNGYEFFILSDGRVKNGFNRLALWYDSGVPKGNNNLMPYERLAGRIGYAISLGKGHNDFSLETTLGAGYTWGNPPAYSQFFAGNTASNFLYESFRSVNNRTFPEGPVIRSLGEKEGGMYNEIGAMLGGTSYWHVNLNIITPTLLKFTRPLIPNIVMFETPRRVTLRDALKGAVETAKNAIIDDLVDNQGYEDNEHTEKIAETIINKDIRPTVNYLADKANIYAIKPMVLFDVANIAQPSIGNKTWVATGAGLQINIVNARLETGYMYTVSSVSNTSKGNLFLRFSVQNFY